MTSAFLLSLVLAGTGQVKLMSPQEEAGLRQFLPKVDDPATAALLADPDLVLYTEREMPRAYQHSGGVHSPWYNISASKPVEPFGNGNREFPWGSAGGTHRCENVRAFRFFRLPKKESGKHWPIVWYKTRPIDGTGIVWVFPRGTVFGEVLTMRGPDKKDYTFELRLRRRGAQTWDIDVFRPFPTAQSLASRIRDLRPGWVENASLLRFVQHITGKRKLLKRELRDRHPVVTFKEVAGVDELPALDDQELVKDLLTTTTFSSAQAEYWYRDDAGLVANAPTTKASFHVVPKNYDAGFIAVDGVSCSKCHDTVYRRVDELQSRRDWYGRVRGADGIFSFHPFSMASISDNGFDIRSSFRKEFVDAGILEQFDVGKHPTAMYRRLEGLEQADR